MRGSNRGERTLLEVAVGLEALALEHASLGGYDERALCEFPLAQLQLEEALDHLESCLGRGEEGLLAACPDPEWPAHAAGEEDRSRTALVEPGRRHRSPQLSQS